jgi:hypothetical protein
MRIDQPRIEHISVGIQANDLYAAFLEDATSKGLVPAEGATPSLMRNDCNNTDGQTEYVFRMWNPKAQRWATGIYSTEEGNQVMLDLLTKKEVQLPQTIGRVTVSGFEEQGSGYLKPEGVVVHIETDI